MVRAWVLAAVLFTHTMSSKKKSVPTPFTPCRNGFGESGLVLCGNGTNCRVEVTIGKSDVLPVRASWIGAIFRIDGATGVRIDKRAIGLRDQTSDRIRRLCGFLGTVLSVPILSVLSVPSVELSEEPSELPAVLASVFASDSSEP